MGDRGMRVFKEGVRGGNERKGAGLGEGFKTRAKRASEGGGILFFEIFFFFHFWVFSSSRFFFSTLVFTFHRSIHAHALVQFLSSLLNWTSLL